MSGVKRFLLWDYPRASWQYDVMVALILAFVFLMPRAIFRDQPRASSIVEVPSDRGRAFLLEPRLLVSLPEAELAARAQAIIKSRYGTAAPVVKVEAIRDPEQEITGFMAFTKP